MASMGFSDAEMQPVIQEIEIESMPVEMPVENGEMIDGQPIIALHSIPEPGQEEVVLQTHEEIVGEDQDNLAYSIPMPGQMDPYMDNSDFLHQNKVKPKPKKPKDRVDPLTGKKWEQKQVQIRTLEGEFSVTMWSSGNDEGKFS